MKGRFILAFAVVTLFALSLAGFAYSGSVFPSVVAACSCCSGDSCPMKKKDSEKTVKKSCCVDCACCKDGECSGDSCPMKKKGESAQDAEHTGMQNNDEQKICDCSCCDHSKEKKNSSALFSSGSTPSASELNRPAKL